MKIVLDVSAAFAIVTGHTSADTRKSHIISAEQVIAPDLFFSESTNAAWKIHYIEEVPPELVFKLAKRSLQLIDFFYSSDSL